MRVTVALVSAIAFVSALAKADNPQRCIDPWGFGLCIPTSDCLNSGGSTATGYCKGQPADVKCCTYGDCNAPYPNDPNGPSYPGHCEPVDMCTTPNGYGGIPIPSHCPGPSNIQCCIPQ
ncbi:hypothetical protein BGX26_007830 [Mortierella sp. AD094]|nr:hypothetical protein BGX26_007830 [Mortierella sp. AD094]